jgi:hypothetical protein
LYRKKVSLPKVYYMHSTCLYSYFRLIVNGDVSSSTNSMYVCNFYVMKFY